jgi:hypothetical protein
MTFMSTLRSGAAQSLLLLMLLTTGSAMAQPASRVQIVSGTTANGAPTDLWQRMLRDRLSPPEFDSVVALRRTLTPAEDAWAALVESRRASWQREIPALAKPFTPAVAPPVALVVLGSVGGSDAFASDSMTIGFDLSQLQASYGAAGLAGNAGLIDRLFRHEYTHVMQKAWFKLHPWHADTPLQSALVDIWLEGQGNYYSLSERWRRGPAGRAAATQEALTALEPKFVARLAALACAAPDRVPSIRQGLSSGRFDQKWGALPIALWLEDERPASLTELRDLVQAGPAGVWALATRHLKEPLRSALNEVRILESACAKPDI